MARHCGVTSLNAKAPNGTMRNMDDFGRRTEEFLKAIQALADDSNVLIFCKEGKHRSAYLAAGLLVATTKSTPSRVIKHIESLRSCVEFYHAKDPKHACGSEALAKFVWEWKQWGERLGLLGNLPPVVTEKGFRRRIDEAARKLRAEEAERPLYCGTL